MNLKSILAFILLIFAAGSVAYVSLRQPENENTLTPTSTATIMVYFFDSDVECDTCQRIESFAHKVVTEVFGDKLATGQIGWAVLDMDTPVNAQFVKEFGLYTKAVVLVRYAEDGTMLKWENLKDVWELVGDKESFDGYITEHLSAFLQEVS